MKKHSIFIPLEQGLRQKSAPYGIRCRTHSIFIPLEQGLRHTGWWSLDCGLNYSIFIPLEQGLRLANNETNLPRTIFYLHSIRTRIKMTKDYILNKIGKKFGCIQDFGYFCRMKQFDILKHCQL